MKVISSLNSYESMDLLERFWNMKLTLPLPDKFWK